MDNNTLKKHFKKMIEIAIKNYNFKNYNYFILYFSFSNNTYYVIPLTEIKECIHIKENSETHLIDINNPTLKINNKSVYVLSNETNISLKLW